MKYGIHPRTHIQDKYEAPLLLLSVPVSYYPQHSPFFIIALLLFNNYYYAYVNGELLGFFCKAKKQEQTKVLTVKKQIDLNSLPIYDTEQI